MLKSIFDLLIFKQKLQIIFLVFFMFVKGALELISISSIPFLILYLLNPLKIVEFLSKNNFDFFSELLNTIELSTILIIVVIIFLVKNFIFLLINIYEENFTFGINVKFRSDLLKHYLMLNYLDLKKDNLPSIIRNISIEVVHFSSALTNIIKISNDSIIILMLLIFVTFVSTLEFILIFSVFALLTLIIFLFLKKKLKKYGELSVKTRGLYIKNITDTFQLIKDILLNNIEKYFLNLFKKNLQLSERVDLYSKIVFSSTKLIFETFAVILLCIIIFVNFESNKNNEELIAYISLITISIIRMLPLFNTVLSEANKLQFRFGSVNTITEILLKRKNISKNYFLSNQNTSHDKYFSNVENILIKNFTSNISGDEILQNINLEITSGSKIALVGSSGSGKTTFLNHLSQLYEIPKNTLFSKKTDISTVKKEWQKIVSYMPQENNLINGSIVENIALGVEADRINIQNLNKSIQFSCSEEFLNKLPEKQHTILGKDGFTLSGGQMQRLCIARALYKNFEILLMDEPTSSIDKSTEIKILSNIFENYKNKTIFVSLHKLELINLFDYLIVFDKKKLFSFTKVKDINKNDKLMSFLNKLKKIKNDD